MTQVLEKVVSEALQLPDAQRIKLACRLLESIEPEVLPEVAEAWEKEIQQRLKKIDSGKASGRSFEEVAREVEEKYGP